MHHCPSCGSILDNDGICPSCGALSRGFFRDLNLGAPQIAAAVQHGLDFYRLLGMSPDTNIRAIARRYRQLRALFPDNPSRLSPTAARRLQLLEVAGRTLTDSYLRRVYDELRTEHNVGITNEMGRCMACAAPLPPDTTACSFCGTPQPAEAQLPAAPPTEPGPPSTEPVDYFGYLHAGLPRDAEAHVVYVGSLLAAEEPLDMGAHTLRQLLASLDELDALDAPHENGMALRALCRGLLARDRGNYAEARSELQQAVQIDKHLAAAWRGLAAIALFRGDHDEAFVACRRALACEPRNERALLMLVGACLRAGHNREAHEAAAQLAALRGGSWTAESVLRELA